MGRGIHRGCIRDPYFTFFFKIVLKKWGISFANQHGEDLSLIFGYKAPRADRSVGQVSRERKKTLLI